MRCRQRGISEASLDLIMSLGTEIRKPGRAYEYFISKKERQDVIQFLKRCIQQFEKLRGKAIVVNGERDKIITAYHKTR
jgi:hypothetical protein